MSKPIYLPNEATTEAAAQRTIAGSEPMTTWMEGLAADDQRRFAEFAHHLYHTAFEDGMSRKQTEFTDLQRQEVLSQKLGIYLLGVNDERNELKKSEGEA